MKELIRSIEPKSDTLLFAKAPVIYSAICTCREIFAGSD